MFKEDGFAPLTIFLTATSTRFPFVVYCEGSGQLETREFAGGSLESLTGISAKRIERGQDQEGRSNNKRQVELSPGQSMTLAGTWRRESLVAMVSLILWTVALESSFP